MEVIDMMYVYGLFKALLFSDPFFALQEACSKPYST